MGSSHKRVGPNGTRWIARYRDARGRNRSAGTFATKREADVAWQQADAAQRSGRAGDGSGHRLKFETYVNHVWFPNHVLEPSTRESYRYCLDRHIIPWFGEMTMRDILPIHVREWVTELSRSGVSPAQVRHLKIVLSAIFTTALNDFVTLLHPVRGVKTPTVPVREYRIVTPAEFERLVESMPNDAVRLLLEVSIGSGLRWGELTELRPIDLDAESRILTVSRAVAEVNPKYHPTGGRFVIKPYPKTKRSRRLKLDATLVAAIQQHIRDHSIGADGLLFDLRVLRPHDQAERPRLVAADQLGMTEPNSAGRQYPHGTLTAYTAGGCRCSHCRARFTAYRMQRRSVGLDSPRGTRSRDTDGHVPRDWFRHQVWIPSCARAGLDPRPRLHDLRHSHASWLLAGGADLQVVKDRLGHGSIATTSKYLHTLPSADETALDALRRIRRPG